jgi:hypothetical protein
MILFVFVDDILIIISSNSSIAMVKRILHDKFFMMDMGPLHYFLGLESIQDASGFNISKPKYARDLMEIFHMKNYKSSPTHFLYGVRLEDGGDTPLVDNTMYRQLVDSFLYLSHSQPYLSYAVGVVSRYIQEMHELHWKDTKCILCYVRGTINYGIHHATCCKLDLIGFIDSDWA